MSLLRRFSFFKDPTSSVNDQLLSCGKEGDVCGLVDALSRGADINSIDQYGETALMWACFGGHVAAVKELLSRGASVHLKAWFGSNALHLAADNGSIEIIREIVKYGANVFEKDAQGRNPLHKCCTKGHCDAIDVFLDLGLDVNEHTTRGNTPIALAAQHGHFETVKFLIRKSAELNKIPDFGGWTVLHRAVGNCDVRMVRLLLDTGADVNAQNTVGATPLHIAVSEADENSLEMIQLLLTYRASLSRKTIDNKKPRDFTDNSVVKQFTQKKHPYHVPTLKKMAATAIWKYHFQDKIQNFPPDVKLFVESIM